MDAYAFLKIPSIEARSSNPAFPDWVPVKAFWFGEGHEQATANNHKLPDSMSFVAEANSLVNVLQLYDSRRTGVLVAGFDTPAEFVGLASDASRLGEAPPPQRWPRVRVYDLHLYLREAVVTAVSQSDTDITFTLHGSKWEEGSLYQFRPMFSPVI